MDSFNIFILSQPVRAKLGLGRSKSSLGQVIRWLLLWSYWVHHNVCAHVKQRYLLIFKLFLIIFPYYLNDHVPAVNFLFPMICSTAMLLMYFFVYRAEKLEPSSCVVTHHKNWPGDIVLWTAVTILNFFMWFR